MNNTINPDHIVEPNLQVYIETDIDVLCDLGIPAGAALRAAEHRALLLDCTKKTPCTLIAKPEPGATHIWGYIRDHDRSFRVCLVEALVPDADSEEEQKGKIQFIRAKGADPEKDYAVVRDLYRAYLQADDAVRRLVPDDVVKRLDLDSGVLFPVGMDSYTLVRGEERPALHCYQWQGLLTKEVDTKPYFLHTCVIPDFEKQLKRQGVFGRNCLDAYNGSRAEKVSFPASLVEMEANQIDSPYVLSYEVREGNPKFYSEDGVVYRREGEKITLFKFPEARTGSFRVPEGVTEIGKDAFAGAKLQELLLPASLKRLGEAFEKCDIRRLFVPADVESIVVYDEIVYDIAPENKKYFSVDDILCEHGPDGDTVLRCPVGKGGSVDLPEGITVIGEGAFSNTSLQKLNLPVSLRSIRDQAFRLCSLEELWLPKNVAEIGEKVFIKMYRWHEDKPYTLTSIRVDPENERFYDVDGVLFERDGKERILLCYPPAREKQPEYTVPEGTTMIGKTSFSDENTPKKIIMPKHCAVNNEARAGGQSANLEWYAVFPADCAETRVKLPNYCSRYVKTPRSAAYALLVQSGKSWESAAASVVKKDPTAADAALAEMIVILEESFSEACAKKAVQFALDNSKSIQPKTFRAFYALLHKRQPKCLRLLLEDLQAQQILLGEQEESTTLHPAEKLVREHWTTSASTNNLKALIPKGLPYKDGDQLSSQEAVIFVIDAYGRQFSLPRFLSAYETDYCAAAFSEEADQVAAFFQPQPFRELLEKLAFDERNEKLGLLLAFGRYADADQIRRLIGKMKDWGKWWSNAATGRRIVVQARGGLMLSDTRPAMAELDRCGVLGAYAALRGTDADTLRDTVLSDFGFESDGKKRFDLGGNVLAVSVEKDLSLTFYDENGKKTIKSVPKKGADPERWEAVKGELSELRKSIRLVLTNRRRKLFAGFLSGEEQSAENWEKLYLGNPVLGSLARITVWQQGDKSFLLGENGLIDVEERPYALSTAPVKVAHPIELAPGEAELWQNYLLKKGLKQPFLQVWEPAYAPSDIKEDRYAGCELSVYKFSGREKDGISSYGMTDYSEDYGFRLKDCTLEAENSAWRFIHGVTDDAVYKLGKFHITRFSRVCNHIIFLLDKWTVEERVAKDDADLSNLVTAFTAAQITELISLAQEKNSVKALAQLLEIKNSRFGTVDLDAEFTLD